MIQVEYSYIDEELHATGLPTSPEILSTMARQILSTIGFVIGLLPDEKPNLFDNFFSIGGNSINAVLVLAKLNDSGLKIRIEKFIEAESILDIVRIAAASVSDQQDEQKVESNRRSFFQLRKLRVDDKEQVSMLNRAAQHLQYNWNL